MDTQIAQIGVVVFSYYPQDTRVRREAEALVEAGMSVDIICLRDHGALREEVINGARIFRLPLQQKRGGRLRYLWEYVCFILMAFLKLSLLYIHRHYSLIHVHNMPDILVFSALIPRLRGAKVILDLHDSMPEVYMAKYSAKESHPAIRLLRFIEKYSIGFADLVLTPTIACRDLFVSRSCPKWKIHMVMNSPQEKIFCGGNTKMNQYMPVNRDEFVVMCHGTIVERNGLDKALEALARMREEIPNLAFHVYGNGDFVNRFLDRVDELDLGDLVNYHGYVPAEIIVAAICSIDVGLIPNESSKHWDLCMPTRIFEYLCMGKPVIAPRTKGILDYFDDESIHFFESGNAQSLAEAILNVYRNSSRCQAVLERGIAVYQAYRWELQRQHFVKLVTDLLGIDALKLEQQEMP